MIRFKGRPTADEQFNFTLDSKPGITHSILASIEGETVYSQEFGCDDPPCHEMMYIEPEFAGKTLEIRYRNSIGESANFSFNVGYRYLTR